MEQNLQEDWDKSIPSPTKRKPIYFETTISRRVIIQSEVDDFLRIFIPHV